MNRVLITACVVLGLLVPVGCGRSGTIAADTPASSSASAPSAQAQTVIDVKISGGTVTPTNARWNATVGQPIVLRVISDIADELHVHSIPDHEFEIAPGENQSFEFVVSVPGSVEIELHHLGRTVGTILVQP